MSAKENIKKLRVALGLELAELAKELNVSKGTISNWEHGRRAPRLSTIRDIVALAKKHKLKFAFEDFV